MAEPPALTSSPPTPFGALFFELEGIAASKDLQDLARLAFSEVSRLLGLAPNKIAEIGSASGEKAKSDDTSQAPICD